MVALSCFGILLGRIGNGRRWVAGRERIRQRLVHRPFAPLSFFRRGAFFRIAPTTLLFRLERRHLRIASFLHHFCHGAPLLKQQVGFLEDVSRRGVCLGTIVIRLMCDVSHRFQ